MIRTKSGAAGLSVSSNSVLIILKVVAGAITGSIAILTEAIHSAIDLLASVVALISVRKADEPADEDHPFGHARVENLAAAIEGALILIAAGIIIFEATRRLSSGSELSSLGVGIAVIAVSAAVNLAISTFLYRRAREHDSPALAGDAAHLRTDAFTSAGVLVGLALVEITGEPAFDAIAALAIAVGIVVAGLRILLRSSRVLVDEAPPPAELDRIEGIITDGDLRRLMQKRKKGILELTAAECMSKNPTTVSGDELAGAALHLMEERKITSILVVDSQRRLQGVIHVHDLWTTQLF